MLLGHLLCCYEICYVARRSVVPLGKMTATSKSDPSCRQAQETMSLSAKKKT